MLHKLVIVSLLVLALIICVEGDCDTTVCDSQQEKFLNIVQNPSDISELCQTANTYIDCAKKMLKGCGEDSSLTTIQNAQNLMNEQGCGSAGLFVCIPLLILLLFLSRSVN